MREFWKFAGPFPMFWGIWGVLEFNSWLMKREGVEIGTAVIAILLIPEGAFIVVTMLPLLALQVLIFGAAPFIGIGYLLYRAGRQWCEYYNRRTR